MEIVKNFDALSRNERFKQLFDNFYHDMMVNHREFVDKNYIKDENISEFINSIKQLIEEFEKEYCKIDFTSNNFIDFNNLF